MPGFKIILDEQEIDIPSPQFEVGNYVTSKRLGLPGAATIIGLEYAQIYKKQWTERKNKLKRWTELYPGWDEKWVYTLFFRSPQKVQSLDEYLYDRRRTPSETLEFMYQTMIPKSYLIVFPEDDIEMM